MTVWILEPDPATAQQLYAAWKAVAANQIDLQLFAALPTSLEGELPDLLMAEITSQCEQVTDLLLTLRQHTSTDFLPVTSDTSPSSFTRAQQLGAIDYILKPFTSRRLRKSLRRYLALKRGLSAGSILTQGQLDRFFFSGESRKQLPLLGVSEVEQRHCRRVLEALLRFPKQQCMADDMAAVLSVSRVTARKYLDILVKANFVDKIAVHSRTGTGRPRFLYQLKGDLL